MDEARQRRPTDQATIHLSSLPHTALIITIMPNASQPLTKERERMRSEAEDALAANPSLQCPSFECSRVFALLAKLLESPPAPLTRKKLVRNVNTIFQFVVMPDGPLDPSNPRTKPVTPARGKDVREQEQGGGAFKPALWYVDLKKNGTIARGYPPKGLLGRKKRADVTIECCEWA